MNLRAKITGIIAILAAIWALTSFLLLKVAVMPGFLEVERAIADGNTSRVTQALDRLEFYARSVNFDWSPWDDTYRYATGDYPAYEPQNLYYESLANLDIDLMVLLDRDNGLVWGSAVDQDTETLAPMESLISDRRQLDHLIDLDSGSIDGVSGWINSKKGPIVVSVYPIIRSDLSGPPVGTLVVGFVLNDRRLAIMRRESEIQFEFSSTDQMGFPSPEFKEQVSALSPGQAAVFQRDDALHAYTRIAHLGGNSGFILKVKTPRDVSRTGYRVLALSAALLFVAGALFVWTIAFTIRRQVIFPVTRLSQHMADVQATGALEKKASLKRADEIGALADQFDNLTGELATTYRAMENARDSALEASKAKSAFLATMSHEIRTPINGVIGSTDLLMTTQLDAKQKRFASVVQSSAQSLLDLIDDVLDFSRIEANKLDLEISEFAFRPWLEETVCMLSDGALRKGLNIATALPPAMNPVCRGDAAKLRQVVTNLLANAIKFTETGEIIVRARQIKAHGRDVVRLEVSDTGVGIEPEAQARIFDSFTQADSSTTRRFGGSGLGLSICSGLIKLMGGRIGLESTLGKGSTFWIEAPIDIVGQDDNGPLLSKGAFENREVLIVDDSRTNRQLLSRELEAWGMHSDSVTSGFQALEKLASKHYDLVLIDSEMPQMTGTQLAEKIYAADGPDCSPMVLLSSSVDDIMEPAQLQQFGIIARIDRPVRRAALLDCLISAFSLTGDFPEESETSSDSQPHPAQTARKILLVDDQIANLEVVSAMLEVFGHEAQVAEDGLAALEILSVQSFDCVLMDCEMPRMDGYEATARIRQLDILARSGLRLPVIALTANVTPGAGNKCLDAGMDDYLAKPIRLQELKAFLSKMWPDSPGHEHTREAPAAKMKHQSSASNIIDETVLDGILELGEMTGKNLLPDIIKKYQEDSRVIVSELVAAIARQDQELTRQRVHALKSSSLQLSSHALAQVCQELEQAATEGRMDKAETMLEPIREEHMRFSNFLSGLITAGSQQSSVGSDSQTKATALVVDDEAATRMLLREFLEHEGFAVEEAEDGPSGLLVFESAKPDFVLLDIEMPGLNGIQVCKQIRRTPAGRNVPILMLSGHTNPDYVARASAAGANDYVSKPINWKKLSAQLPRGRDGDRRVHVVTAMVSESNNARIVYEVFDFLSDAESFAHSIEFQLDPRIDSMIVNQPANLPREISMAD